MSKARSFTAVAAAALVIGAGGVLATTTASAETAAPSSVDTLCVNPQVCAYKDSSFGGDMFPFTITDGYWGNDSQGEGFIDDEASSFDNQRNVTVGIWQDASWGGPFIWCGAPTQYVLGLGVKTDEASSNWMGDCNSGHQ